MAKGENLDYKVTIGINSKQFNATIRKCNQETREFKRQQKEAFKQAGESATSGFGKAIAAAKKLAPAIGLGATALKAAQTAMQENQRYTDEWGRITESAKASYESFVDSLVNADFSGFFKKMDAVIQSARDAYDALDAVGTANIFSSKELADLDLKAAEYRLTLRSKSSTEEEKAAARAGLSAVRNSQMDVARTLSDTNLVAFADLLVSRLTSKGAKVSRSDFIRMGDNGYEVVEGGKYEKYLGYLSNYNAENARYQAFSKADVRKNYLGEEYRAVEGLGIISEAEFKDLKAFMEISDEKLRESFDYYIKSRNEIKKVIEMMTSDSRYMGGLTTGGAGKSTKVYAEGSEAWLEQQISELMRQAYESADKDVRQFAYNQAQKYKEELKMKKTDYGGLMQYLPGVGLQGMSVGFNKTSLNTFPSQPITPATDTSKDLANASEIAVNGIELVTDTMRQLGITSEIADEGLRKTLSILGNALAIVGNSIGGVWGKGLTALGGIIGSFEGGGIVGGTSYTGDHLTAKVNSKEMWLSTSQQSRLLGMINGSGGAGGGSYNAMLTGENLYFALRNYGRRTGKIYLP